jgi:hypothetical protein
VSALDIEQVFGAGGHLARASDSNELSAPEAA